MDANTDFKNHPQKPMNFCVIEKDGLYFTGMMDVTTSLDVEQQLLPHYSDELEKATVFPFPNHATVTIRERKLVDTKITSVLVEGWTGMWKAKQIIQDEVEA